MKDATIEFMDGKTIQIKVLSIWPQPDKGLVGAKLSTGWRWYPMCNIRFYEYLGSKNPVSEGQSYAGHVDQDGDIPF